MISFVAYLGFAFTANIALIAVLFVGYRLYQGIFRSVGKALATDFVPDRLGERDWLVQHDGGPLGSGDERRCRTVVGPCQPCSGIRLWCSFCHYRQHRLADAASRAANSAQRIMSAIGTKQTRPVRAPMSA